MAGTKKKNQTAEKSSNKDETKNENELEKVNEPPDKTVENKKK